MSLTAWRKNGWLTEHEPTPAEIHDLLALIERDLGGQRSRPSQPGRNLGGYERAAQSSTRKRRR